jgi:hypothetical protein
MKKSYKSFPFSLYQKVLLLEKIFFRCGKYITGQLSGKSPMGLHKTGHSRNGFLHTKQQHTAESGQGYRAFSGYRITMETD